MNCCQSSILLKSNIPLRPESTLALIHRLLNISHVYSSSISEFFTSGLDYSCCSGSIYFSRSSFPWPEFDLLFAEQNDLVHAWGLDYKLGYCAQVHL